MQRTTKQFNYGVLCSMALVAMIGMVMIQKVNSVTSYIYAPGLFGSPIVIGRYCPYYVAVTGEKIHGVRGGNVLGDGKHITAVVFPEVNITQSDNWVRRRICPVIAQKILFMGFGIVVEECKDSLTTFFNYLPELGKANIGQAEDISTLRSYVKEHMLTYPTTQIVLYGDSRGAATIFNFIALDHPRVSCAVLEGIFDSIPHVIKHCWLWMNKHSSIENLLHRVLITCTQVYATDGPFPIDYVDKVPRNFPLLLVTSLKDEIVPCQSTMRLYCHLKEKGCTNVHLLVLNNSSHKGYMTGKNKHQYESCVHAFYRAYHVDYDAALADKGQKYFEETQPSVEEVRERYNICKACCQ